MSFSACQYSFNVYQRPPYSPDIAPLSFHLFHTFYVTKNSKINMISDMAPPDILLKNQLIFIDITLTICPLDGKKLMTTRVITRLIKIKDMFKFICLNLM